MAKKKKTVYAAGCLVFKDSGENIEVLLEHRPRYDDWSFPKGKRNKNESNLACALREVEEETGATGTVVAELPTVTYKLSDKKTKIVYFWALRYQAGDFVSNDEVDMVEWFSPAEAQNILSYKHDRKLLKKFLKKELWKKSDRSEKTN